MSKESVHHFGADGNVCKTQRMVRKTNNFNSQLLHNNLFNSMLQKASPGANPLYIDVWQPIHHNNADAAERIVSISFYSYTIFVMLKLNSIFCRTDIRRS
jgi:hypothetical protein